MDIAVIPWLEPLARLLLDQATPIQAGIVGLCVGWMVCPVYMYVLALLTTARWPRYIDQFKGFMPGNLFLGVGFGAASYLAARAEREGSGFFADFPSTVGWVWVPVILGACTVVALSALDVMGALRHQPGDHDTFHWRQLLDPTKVHHNIVVYGLYTWMLVALGVPGLLLAPFDLGGILARVTLAVALGSWIRLLGKDAKNPKHRTGHVAMHGAAGVLAWVMYLIVTVLTVIAVRAVL